MFIFHNIIVFTDYFNMGINLGLTICCHNVKSNFEIFQAFILKRVPNKNIF